ncbi:hypothetical protein QTG56_24480 (plasmid) [Rossellomorea sp. AcN35-11]|nr:hypothetical protein [Rossellomorea aquimaris]WJV31792.1 hypothetical protein QTG56_24480 [Rossellomorea sp. AcN35-11]
MKFKFKKALPVFFAGLLLVACAPSDEPSNTEQNEEAKQDQKHKESEKVKTEGEQEIDGSQETEDGPLTKEKAIKGAKAVLDTQVKAIEEEDVDLYMSTLLTAGEQADYTKEQLKLSFEANDLIVEFENIDVESVSDDFNTVVLEVVQITRSKEENRDFIDSKVTLIQTLEHTHETWLITSTEHKSMKALE